METSPGITEGCNYHISLVVWTLRSLKEVSALGPLASPDAWRVHTAPIRFAHQRSTYAGNTSSIFEPLYQAKTSLDASLSNTPLQ